MNNFSKPIKKVSDSENKNNRNLPAETNTEKETPPLEPSQDQDQRKEISTSRKHGMDYFTTDGVILRTGYKNKWDWYLLPIREMLDNDIDFLWKHYKGSNNARINVDIKMDDKIFYLKIGNSNDENVPVFANLKAIFDYGMRYGSKQDVHIITRGMLGDALKQILSLGYVLLHAGDDGTTFEDKQWDHPLIIRHNKKEWLVNLNFDKAQQEVSVNVTESSKQVTNTDTEIELKLPVIDQVRDALTRDYVEKYCREYAIPTTDISFKFSIVDDITHPPPAQEMVYRETDIGLELVKALSKTPEKGILHIDMPALHAISLDKDWSNADSIWSYTPEEFMARIRNVHDKENTFVYDVLKTFREGSNIPKTAENDISISKLVSRKNRHKTMEKFFKQLRSVFDPPKELSLPYTTNPKKRKEILYSRLVQSQFYDIDREKEPVYKIVRGFYDDTESKKVWVNVESYGEVHKAYSEEKGQGIVRYPFAFEILAVPRTDPLEQDNPAIGKDTIFIGAVNYSVSPKSNSFEGDYLYKDYWRPKNIPELLQYCGFKKDANYNVRLPCIVVGNLITPRRDPVGYDKSMIDTQPFAKTIVTAIEKMAPDIQTYRAAGFTFTTSRGNTGGKYRGKYDEVSGKELLRQFLIKERGLPDKYERDTYLDLDQENENGGSESQ